MATDSDDQIQYELIPYIRQFKDGRVQRLRDIPYIAPGLDEPSGVASKDVPIPSPTPLSARIHLPPNAAQPKLPIFVYFHGGAFVLCSAFDAFSHVFLTSLSSQSNAIAVSVDYRLAPEHPLPAAYDDAWTAVQWLFSHVDGNGTEDWLNRYGDFSRVFLAGGSAGGNIAHHIALRLEKDRERILRGVRVEGMVLIHPFFWGIEAIGNESREAEVREKTEGLWKFVCPESEGADDPRINPLAEGAAGLRGVACGRALVAVAEKDWLRDRGVAYYEALRECKGEEGVKLIDSEGVGHGFIVQDPESERSLELMKAIVDFINGVM